MIEELIGRMAAVGESLRAAGDQRQFFHATYQRTTVAVAAELRRGGFTDAEWVGRWDVAFADLYLDALQTALAGGSPTRPWDIAFGAPAGLPPLRHVLLGMNAHINYDLPQALLAVITDDEFDNAALLATRRSDHQAIDRVLASRVGAEDDELAAVSGPGSLLDRLLQPLNRLATQRFLREAREKVWANAVVLSRARREGPGPYAVTLKQLEDLSAAKVAAFQAPGQVLLKLARTGFGVQLPGLADGDAVAGQLGGHRVGVIGGDHRARVATGNADNERDALLRPVRVVVKPVDEVATAPKPVASAHGRQLSPPHFRDIGIRNALGPGGKVVRANHQGVVGARHPAIVIAHTVRLALARFRVPALQPGLPPGAQVMTAIGDVVMLAHAPVCHEERDAHR